MQQTFLRTLEIHCNIFDNSHLKFGKREKAKIKKQHVSRPVLTSVGFLKSMVLQIFPKYSQLCQFKCQKVEQNSAAFKKQMGGLSFFYLDVTCRTLQELFRMALVKFMTFVVLKILDDLVSMQNSLNANIADVSKTSKTVQSKLTCISNILPEFSIHYTQLSIVIA